MEIRVDDEKSYVDVAEFFVSEDETDGDKLKTSTYSEIDTPIKDLKALVLTLDWDIAEETMRRFSLEVERLEAEWKADKVLTNLLKILHALGKYINNKKSKAHPDSIKFLYSTYNSLEKIVLSPNMNQDRRLALATLEINRFKDFKKQVDTLAAKGDTIRVADKAIKGTSETAAVIVERLKAVAATLDAQADDRRIAAILEDIDRLHRAWSDDRTLLAFLRLLTLLTNQVKEKRPLAHPEVFEQMRAVAVHLGQVAFSQDLTFREKNDLAARDVKRYQDLQKLITGTPLVPQAKPKPAAANVLDDLFKAQPASPVDEQLTDIHLAVLVDNYAEVRAATLLRQTEGRQDSETREIVGKQPSAAVLPDIERRLTDFFGGDAGEAWPAGSEGDGQVVPYREEVVLVSDIEAKAGPAIEATESVPTIELISQISIEEPLPEIGERLNEFFQEDGDLPAATQPGDDGEIVAYPESGEAGPQPSREPRAPRPISESTSLADLLNLAGEIEPTAEASLFELFRDEVNLLGEAWSDHPDRILLLRLLKSLAQYIGKQRDQARPGSVELLRSLCNGLESVVLLAEHERDESLGIFTGLLNRYLDFLESLGEAPLALATDDHEISIERLSVQEEAAEFYHAATEETRVIDSAEDHAGAIGIREANSSMEEAPRNGLWQKIIRLFAFKK